MLRFVGCLENEDRRPKTKDLETEDPLENEDLEKEDPLENEDLENEDPLENEDLEKEDPLENEDLENEDPLENEDLENEDPLENEDLENEDPLEKHENTKQKIEAESSVAYSVPSDFQDGRNMVWRFYSLHDHYKYRFSSPINEPK